MRVLCIGHSYVVPENRAIEKWIAGHCNIEIGILGPAKWPGDLRKLEFEFTQTKSNYSEFPVETKLPKFIHLFSYNMREIREVLQKGWDGVYVWEEPYVRAALRLGREIRACGLPYTFLTDQNIPKRFPWPFSRWEREFVKGSKGWAGCGMQVLEVQKQRGYPQENVVLLPHCVDTSRFRRASPEAKEKIHAQWGLRGPVIGYVGRFVEEKGIDLILEVLGKIDLALWGGLVFLGSGPMEPIIRKWIKEKGFDGRARVELIKHGDMPDVLPGIDILFSASQTRKNWKEQLGRMLIEAMACGIPNVASDSGEIPNTVGAGGIIFPEHSPMAAQEALERLLRDPGLRESIGNLAIQESRRFSCETLGPQMLAFWKKAFGGSGALVG